MLARPGRRAADLSRLLYAQLVSAPSRGVSTSSCSARAEPQPAEQYDLDVPSEVLAAQPPRSTGRWLRELGIVRSDWT